MNRPRHVTGGQDADGEKTAYSKLGLRPSISLLSIERFQTSAKVVEGQSQAADYLLTATLFTLVKAAGFRTNGQTRLNPSSHQ